MFYHNLLGFYYFYPNVGNPPVVSPAPASTGHDIVPPPATPRRDRGRRRCSPPRDTSGDLKIGDKVFPKSPVPGPI